MEATQTRAQLWDGCDGLLARIQLGEFNLIPGLRADLAELRYVSDYCCEHSKESHRSVIHGRSAAQCNECVSVERLNAHHGFYRGRDGIDEPEPARGTVSDAGSNPAGSTTDPDDNWTPIPTPGLDRLMREPSLLEAQRRIDTVPVDPDYVGEPCFGCGSMRTAREGGVLTCHNCGFAAP